MKRALRGLLVRLRGIVFRRAAEREMDEELRFHIDMETEKNLRAGMDRVEARRQALVAFGGVERHRERLREGRRLPVLESLWRDLRFGVRSLARDPGLSLVAALTMAVGIGATTAVFSVVNAVLLRPFPVSEPGDLFSIQEERSGAVATSIEGVLIPYPRYLEYREATRSVFDALAAHRVDEFSLRLPEATVAAWGALTSGNYFQTLGVQPFLGRAYTSDDAPEVVISHDLWRNAFGGDSAVVGRGVSVDGRPVTVVGVGPKSFAGVTGFSNQVWLPVGLRAEADGRWARWVVPFGRLGPDVSLERAEDVVEAAGAAIPPRSGTTVRRAALDPLSPVPRQQRVMVASFLGLLLGMALLVLFIAGANIAGVLLARASARQREAAVRVAVGAGPVRMVRHFLAESLLLSGLGGIGGVLLAYGSTAWLARLRPPPQFPVTLELSPDARVLLFALALTGLTGLVFGILPALQASRPDLVPALKEGVRGSSSRGGRMRRLFVGGQIALTTLLLVVAMLFARSLRAGLTADLGFDSEGIVVATVDLGPPLEYTESDRRRFFGELLEWARARPGVVDAELSRHAPLSVQRSSSDLRRVEAPDARRVGVGHNAVGPGFFDLMDLELVAGRGFTDADDAGSTPVAVVNETLVEALFQGGSPLGRRIRGIGPGDREIVGVVRDSRYRFVTEDPAPFAFVPWEQRSDEAAVLTVRAPGFEGATLRALRAEVRARDPDVALRTAAPLSELIALSLFPQRSAAQLVGIFGLVGLFLAGMGVYGVLAYHVSRRTREFGIRRALGARGADVMRGVAKRGGVLAVVGCAVGVALAAVVAEVVENFLFEVEPLDPISFLTVPAVLLLVALAACFVPARRAGAVEAVDALREE